MGKLRSTLLLACLLAVAGCAGLHVAPIGEHAQVVLVGGEAPTDVAEVDYLRVYRDVRCNGARTRALSIGPGDARDASLEVEGSQRVFLFGTAERWGTRDVAGHPGAVDLVGNRCEYLVSFITVPSHVYRVSEHAGDAACRIFVIDEQTARPPPDLAEHDSTLCNELGRRRQPAPAPQRQSACRQDVPRPAGRSASASCEE
ncbi:MAG TPA: hypothetical protein VFS55_08950 [Dokdonella sp.]|nr:hypothetical protein [Dokdonella sp.]